MLSCPKQEEVVMMGAHFKALSAVFPVILGAREGTRQVLLAQRANTGYMDGLWDFAGSGHVEEGETTIQALVRECREEIGIAVDPAHVRFAHLSHRLGLQGERTYYDLYFFVDRFQGEPRIAEPEKCADLQWFDLESLPGDMISIRRDALAACLQGRYYSEVLNGPGRQAP